MSKLKPIFSPKDKFGINKFQALRRSFKSVHLSMCTVGEISSAHPGETIQHIDTEPYTVFDNLSGRDGRKVTPNAIEVGLWLDENKYPKWFSLGYNTQKERKEIPTSTRLGNHFRERRITVYREFDVQNAIPEMGLRLIAVQLPVDQFSFSAAKSMVNYLALLGSPDFVSRIFGEEWAAKRLKPGSPSRIEPQNTP